MAKKEGKTAKSTLPCLPEDFFSRAAGWFGVGCRQADVQLKAEATSGKVSDTQSKIKSTWEGGTINTTSVACTKVRYSLPHSPLARGKRKEGMKENISVSIYLSIRFNTFLVSSKCKPGGSTKLYHRDDPDEGDW